MRSKIVLMTTMLAMVLAALPLATDASAQNLSTWDGVYTDAQADRGKAQYNQYCAICHMTTLRGNGEAPPLTGRFIPDWEGTSLADLFDKISTTMPLDNPGSLDRNGNTDILAFILQSNSFPAGAKELDPGTESLKMIRFDATKLLPIVKAKSARSKHPQ